MDITNRKKFAIIRYQKEMLKINILRSREILIFVMKQLN